MTPLSPVQQKFILHWGEMGTRWGINRTVAQIHALLFISPKPLHAEDIARRAGCRALERQQQPQGTSGLGHRESASTSSAIRAIISRA